MDLYEETPRIENLITNYPELKPIHNVPVAHWIGSKPGKNLKNIKNHIKRLKTRAGNKRLLLVIYDIPNRDLGNHSHGGSNNKENYLKIIDELCDGIGDSKPIVIFEPDALPLAYSNMQLNQRLEQENLIYTSLKKLKENTNSFLYLDVGHCNWLLANYVVNILTKYKSLIHGFCLNTSNYWPVEDNVLYAREINSKLSNPLPWVIDTSRNGNPDFDGNWCNPSNRRIGYKPTYNTNIEMCDAFLWIKVPGESDGKCNGGPAAGVFWIEKAKELCEM